MEISNSSHFSPGPELSSPHIPFQTGTLLVLLNISLVSTIHPSSFTSLASVNQSLPPKLSVGKVKVSKIDPSIRIVWLLFGPIIFVVGVCGNIFVLIIMTRKIMGGTSTCVHLSVMAIADLTVTLIGLTPEWFEICFDAPFKNIHPITCKVEKFFFYSAADVSVWTLVIFTLDRYVAVCHPLRKKAVCTAHRARYFSSVAIMVALAKNAHVFWTRGIQYKMDKVTKQLFIRKLCGTTDPGYEYFESYVRSWIVFIFVNGLPAIIISICNFFIVKSMFSISKKSCATSTTARKSNVEANITLHKRTSSQAISKDMLRVKTSSNSSLNLSRHSIANPGDLQIPGKTSIQSRYLTQTSLSLPRNKSPQQHQQRTLAVSSIQSINNKALVQMTAMCLAASICFLVCNTPSVVLYVGREYWEKNEGYYIFKPMYNIFVYVNHAINFILYCLTGQRFRRVFVDFCRCGLHRDNFMASRRYSDWGDNNSVNLVNLRPGYPQVIRKESFLEVTEDRQYNRRNTVNTKTYLEEIEEV